MKYRSDGLRSISAQQARTFDSAARIFAHRLGRNLFGRSGRCFSLRRTFPNRSPRQVAMYQARIGATRGHRTEIEFVVTVQED